MSHETCKKAHDMLHGIMEAIDNGMPISQSDAIRYLLDRAICKDHRMEVYWKGYQREVNGATYPEDHVAGMSTDNEIEKWVHSMTGKSGHGAHWTMEQTKEVAKKHQATVYDPVIWWATMNMMWSDYHDTAVKNNVDTVQFYACLSKDFLDDEDAPTDKLRRYVWAMKH